MADKPTYERGVPLTPEERKLRAEGKMCRNCRNPPAPGMKKCAYHLKMTRESVIASLARKKAGIPKGKPGPKPKDKAPPAKKTAETRGELSVARGETALLRAQRKICRRCRRPPVPGMASCQIHLADDAARKATRDAAEKGKAPTLPRTASVAPAIPHVPLGEMKKLRARGKICNRCTRPPEPGKKQCAFHLEMQRRYYGEKYSRKTGRPYRPQARNGTPVTALVPLARGPGPLAPVHQGAVIGRMEAVETFIPDAAATVQALFRATLEAVLSRANEMVATAIAEAFAELEKRQPRSQ